MNDYAALANREGLPPAIFAQRRAAAYQAYFEHMPIRPSLWRSRAEPRLYRGIDWGDLASLSVLDTRQYRSAPPCAALNVARNGIIDQCADVLRPDRSIMGAAQESWLKARLDREHRPWTLIGQQVFFAPMKLDPGGSKVWSDQWDGYAANRQRLTDQLAGPAIRNAIVLSGDIHSFWANELRRDALSGKGGVIGTEIVTAALAAQSPPADRFGEWRANNPHIRFGDITHSGWVSLDIARDRLKGQMRAVDRMVPNPPQATILTSFEIESGQPIRLA
jgi:alkaline phosphatase D